MLMANRRGLALVDLETGSLEDVSTPTVDFGRELFNDGKCDRRGRFWVVRWTARARRRPDKLHADKAYDHRRCREACARRGIAPRIARRGVATRQKLSRHRWVIEGSFAWLNRLRRLVTRYGRRSGTPHAFTALACSLICFNVLKDRF